jgi:hypothetical protein
MEQITELENYIEEQETQETVIEQVPNTYYYDKLYDDKHLGSFTESTQLAYQLGWQDNTVAITDTEVSELNGWTYLKGYAPKKPLEAFKEQKHAELKQIMQAKRKNVKVNYDNDTFDANEEAQSNMVVLLKAFDLGAQTVSIRSSTEETHTFDKEHCQELSLIMLSAVQAIYDQYWDLKDLLSNCETVEEVERISWNE